jgi:hypothetical protein
MSKKINIMSLSLEVEIQDHLKNEAKKKGISVSKLIRDLIDKCLPMVEEGVEVDTVILKIPRQLRNNSEELRKWLNLRQDGIVKALAP